MNPAGNTTETMQSTATVSHGLEHSLVYHPTTGLLSRRDGQSTLPGQPWVALSPNQTLLAYVRRNDGASSPSRLQQKVGHLSDRQIVPLHALGRIQLTEHPDLHLARSRSGDETVYLKPVPAYMLSPAFWAWLAAADAQAHAAALGFLRTYSHLVSHEADFRRATGLGLVPRLPPASASRPASWRYEDDDNGDDDGSSSDGGGGGGRITYEGFVAFIAQFAPGRVPNSAVAPRYWYGELGLHQGSSDYPLRLFREPREQEGEGQQHSSNSSSSGSSHSSDRPNDSGAEKSDDNLLAVPLWTVASLALGSVAQAAWGRAPWAAQRLLLGGPLGVAAVFSALMALLRFFEWVLDAAAPRGRVLDAARARVRPMAARGVAFLLATGLMAGLVVVGRWGEVPDSLAKTSLMPLAVYAGVAALVVGVQISQWVCGEWVPIPEVSQSEEAGKEAETKTGEKELLIEGLDMV